MVIDLIRFLANGERIWTHVCALSWVSGGTFDGRKGARVPTTFGELTIRTQLAVTTGHCRNAHLETSVQLEGPPPSPRCGRASVSSQQEPPPPGTPTQTSINGSSNTHPSYFVQSRGIKKSSSKHSL